MARYTKNARTTRRKRTVAAFFVAGFLLLALPAVMFYGHIRQERLLTASDPPGDVSTDMTNEGAVSVPQDFFEPAEEKSVEVRQMHDKQRRANIDAIHQALQEYYAEKGAYPRATNMNSDGFRRGAFPDLTNEDFMDPDSTDSSVTLTRTPQATVYAYDVVNHEGYTCEPIDRTCVDYTLTALLSDNSLYSVTTKED